MQEAGLELLEILVGKFVRHSVSFMEHVGSMGNTLAEHQKVWFRDMDLTGRPNATRGCWHEHPLAWYEVHAFWTLFSVSSGADAMDGRR